MWRKQNEVQKGCEARSILIIIALGTTRQVDLLCPLAHSLEQGHFAGSTSGHCRQTEIVLQIGLAGNSWITESYPSFNLAGLVIGTDRFCPAAQWRIHWIKNSIGGLAGIVFSSGFGPSSVGCPKPRSKLKSSWRGRCRIIIMLEEHFMTFWRLLGNTCFLIRLKA